MDRKGLEFGEERKRDFCTVQSCFQILLYILKQNLFSNLFKNFGEERKREHCARGGGRGFLYQIPMFHARLISGCSPQFGTPYRFSVYIKNQEMSDVPIYECLFGLCGFLSFSLQ